MNDVNWRLVFRHVLPALYVPAATMILCAIVVALTGAGRYEYIDEVGYLLAGSSLVLVFARLATRDMASARRNVFALATVCFLFVVSVPIVRGGWRDPNFWLGASVLAALLATAAFVGLRWARRWARITRPGASVGVRSGGVSGP